MQGCDPLFLYDVLFTTFTATVLKKFKEKEMKFKRAPFHYTCQVESAINLKTLKDNRLILQT